MTSTRPTNCPDCGAGPLATVKREPTYMSQGDRVPVRVDWTFRCPDGHAVPWRENPPTVRT